MTRVLATPLLPAAIATTAVAIVLELSGLAAVLLAVTFVGACMVLTLASVGPRRLIWASAATAATLLLGHVVVPIALLPSDLLSLAAPRDLLARPITELIGMPESSILLGIVLGERSAVPAALSRAFATSGTTHLLAISGFNMTLVASAIALVVRRRASPLARAAVVVAAIAFYSLLVGLSPSVLRAALMAAVAACGLVTGRRAATANALCAAVAAMLIADAHAVSDVGLQLSALATGGLVAFQQPIATRLSAFPRLIAEGAATTIAATLPTLPLIAATFGRISLVSVIANLVCVPLFPVLMLAGAATSVMGLVSLDAARPVALVAWASAFALRTAVETFAALPLASLDVPPGPLTGVGLAAIEVGVVCVARRVRIGTLHPSRALATRLRGIIRPAVPRHVPIVSAVAAVALVAAAPVVAAAAWPENAPVRVVALDVGQGDAYLVETGSVRMLIDGGPDGARVLEELGAMLPPWDRRIDLVAITHAHTDHGAGLLSVLERYDVGLAIEPQGLNAGPLADLWAAAIAKNGAQRRAVRAGQRIRLGDTVVEVLAPDADLAVDTPSLVLRVQRGSFSALFTGDAVDDALARLLEHPERLASRVYVPPHHGAATPYASALRSAAHPEVALISVGAGNRYGHPTPQTLAALQGVTTYRTDQDGTVEIAFDGTGLVARTHANGLPPPRRGPLPYTPARG